MASTSSGFAWTTGRPDYAVTRDDVVGACALLRQYPGLSVRDAIHVATMLRNGLKTVVRVDPDFDQVSAIRRVSP